MSYNILVDICDVLSAVGLGGFVICLITAAVLRRCIDDCADKKMKLKLQKARTIIILSSLGGLVLGIIMIVLNHHFSTKVAVEMVYDRINSSFNSTVDDFIQDTSSEKAKHNNTECISNSDYINHYRTLGKILYEGSDTEYPQNRVLVVETENQSIEIVLILTDDTITKNVYYLIMSVQQYINIYNDKEHINYIWLDANEQPIAMYTVSKRADEWKSSLGILWLDSEYQSAYNELHNQIDDN